MFIKLFLGLLLDDFRLRENSSRLGVRNKFFFKNQVLVIKIKDIYTHTC